MVLYYAPPLIGGGIKWCFCLTPVCLTVMYIGPNSRTERPRKTKIGTPRHTWLRHHFQGQSHQAALVGGSSHYIIYVDCHLCGLLCHCPERVAACRSWIFMAQGTLGAAGVRCVWAAACGIQGQGHIEWLSTQLVNLKFQSSMPLSHYTSLISWIDCETLCLLCMCVWTPKVKSTDILNTELVLWYGTSMKNQCC